MATEITARAIDLTDCDKEPIHIPNLIQPHGVLLVVEEKTKKILQVGANSLATLGSTPEETLNRFWPDVLGEKAALLLMEFVAHSALGERPLAGPRILIERTGREFETVIHRTVAGLIIELIDCESMAAIPLALLHEAINQIEQTSSVVELCQRAVEYVRRFAGFDRVMVYQFLDDESGVVIAEAARTGIGSYLGHHFPASDIPRQARALYCRSWVRIIADVDAQPVPLLPALSPRLNQPLDMTHSLLRHVSPIHIEYLRNMRVRASTSLSIVQGNRLWGLIACHHDSPKSLSAEARIACELIAHLLSIQMHFKERQETIHQRTRLRRIQRQLEEALSEDTLFEQNRLAAYADVLPLLEASGFVLHLEGRWATIGQAPSHDALLRLMTWLNGQSEDIVAVESWAKECPLPQEPGSLFAGFLAIRISRQENGYAFWFRPEWVHTISWAGDPNKPVEPGGNRLNPRKSFDLWTETVQGRSRPWRIFEKVWAQEIRRSLVEFILRRNERRLARLNEGLEKEISLRAEELRRKDQALNQASKLEAIGRFSGSIAHDFNNLLVGIVGIMEEIKDSLPRGDARVQDISDVLQTTDRAFALTKQLLSFARRQPAKPMTIQLNDAIGNMAKLLRNLAGSRVRIDLDLQEIPTVTLDQTHLEQILLNLVVNSRDAMEGEGTITLRTRTASADVPQDKSVILEVQDTGTGMSSDVQAHIFEPFYSTKGSDTGTGLGLATVYGIVKQAQGEIDVESKLGHGTIFRLQFPAAHS